MLADTNMLEYDSTMNVNVRATFQLISLAVPFLKFSDKKPSITVLSGSAGVTPVPGAVALSVSMAMVNMLVKNSALEVGHLGIRVNAVAPGVTNTRARENKQSRFWGEMGEEVKGKEEQAR